MIRYAFSLGSNVSKAREEIEKAINYLTEILRDARVSSIYTSPSIKGDGTIYHNAVVTGLSSLDAGEINLLCKEYEKKRGRQHGEGAPVVIDIDVVLADDKVLRPTDYSRDYFTRGYKELS